jgi:hypothetical protein
MAIDERRRQKKLARKTARRKKALAAKKSPYSEGGSFSAGRMMAQAAAGPIHECLMPAGLFDLGMGSVIISRKMPGGEIGFAVFLLDVFCLGVKNAFFSVRPLGEYESVIGQISESEGLKPVEPACAVKLIRSAEAYARGLGLNAHPDYTFSRRIFADIDPASCSREFTFGQDGKPLYVSGPNETEADSRKIIDRLMKKLGPDGFHYMLHVGMDEEEEE